jgi:hypothetical protein
VNSVAIYIAARKVAEEDPCHVHDHVAEIANVDLDHATGDQDLKIVGRETTKAEMDDLEDINFKKFYSI